MGASPNSRQELQEEGAPIVTTKRPRVGSACALGDIQTVGVKAGAVPVERFKDFGVDTLGFVAPPLHPCTRYAQDPSHGLDGSLSKEAWAPKRKDLDRSAGELEGLDFSDMDFVIIRSFWSLRTDAAALSGESAFIGTDNAARPWLNPPRQVTLIGILRTQ